MKKPWGICVMNENDVESKRINSISSNGLPEWINLSTLLSQRGFCCACRSNAAPTWSSYSADRQRPFISIKSRKKKMLSAERINANILTKKKCEMCDLSKLFSFYLYRILNEPIVNWFSAGSFIHQVENALFWKNESRCASSYEHVCVQVGNIYRFFRTVTSRNPPMTLILQFWRTEGQSIHHELMYDNVSSST